ncbi:hypothetical protein LCGC14_2689510 [marine sediment metagenome]|uniref:Uncharacterized protein n=1 Tax=marine sediment metagenome TaxID=412755 RepID=A0A0F8ZIX4_9ZZZZ
MNIYEAVEKIYQLILYTPFWRPNFKQEIADILQELLDTGGVADEYREIKK